MQLAKLLHFKGFHITYVNTEFNHRRFLRSKGGAAVLNSPDFVFETIPDGLPPSDRDATQEIPQLCDSLRKNCFVPFLELLNRLNSSPETPPVSCVVCDGVMGFGVKASGELGIPAVQFWTASACGFMGYLQYSELVKRGIIPFKDESFLSDSTLETPLDWVPGMDNMRLKDIPSFIRTTNLKEIMFDFMGSETQNCLESGAAIAINTFDELEHEILDAISPPIYSIGPLHLLSKHIPESHSRSFRSNLWSEDSDCINWLDGKPENTVVYVNYGCITTMSEQHLTEFAWGLANSKHHFLWIVRSDVVSGSDSANLPEEFYEEIKDRGMITRWCPQDQVLNHPAVGFFLTHCGWNSMMESVSAGVPMICWPFFAEQPTNCRYACTKWGIGVEVDHDVKRSNIEDLVKEMMEGEEGQRMRGNALELKKKAEAATNVEGSSYRNFDRVITEALLQKK